MNDNAGGLEYAIRMLAIRRSPYESVLADLETIKKMTDALRKEWPTNGAALSDSLYLQTMALNLLAIALLEYGLRQSGKIKNREGISGSIKDSKCLTPLEKDHLLYLLFVRHTISHNGGHFNGAFFKNAEAIKVLKLEEHEDGRLSPIEPSMLKKHITLIEQLILLDLAKDLFSEEEKKIIEESFAK